MDEDQGSSGVGGVFLLLTALFAVWFVGTARTEDQAVQEKDIVIRLAVTKEGDILQFSDGRLCQVATDRGRDTTEIHYVCAGDPQTILTTKIGDLSTQVTDISPPKNSAEAFVSRTVWVNADQDRIGLPGPGR